MTKKKTDDNISQRSLYNLLLTAYQRLEKKKAVLCFLTFTLKLQLSQILLGTDPRRSAC